ncbi:MAG: phosphoglycerate mutase [Rhodobacteraceae bacterium CG17_big_fil_post_rev_8_21_14_2_50_63_15]|nr:histidine phosphatase family protein [Roseovarius sp.]PIV79564.1 MAG: phosphoglycerate mutase [Rhodobacteraceae bacterium CG17_big_fil_post_rev_8_21_14_2_50_63_15]
MRQLILMRHAKSDWDDQTLGDHARPLNKRGRRSATALGHWLRARNLIPDQILCSSAIRAQETCARLKLQIAPDLLDSLYMAEPDPMLADLRGAKGTRVLMIGHNPGIAGFAHLLVTSPPIHGRFDDFPTGATLVANFAISAWSDLVPRSGKIIHFITPHDLT